MQVLYNEELQGTISPEAYLSEDPFLHQDNLFQDVQPDLHQWRDIHPLTEGDTN